MSRSSSLSVRIQQTIQSKSRSTPSVEQAQLALLRMEFHTARCMSKPTKGTSAGKMRMQWRGRRSSPPVSPYDGSRFVVGIPAFFASLDGSPNRSRVWQWRGKYYLAMRPSYTGPTHASRVNRYPLTSISLSDEIAIGNPCSFLPPHRRAVANFSHRPASPSTSNPFP